MLVLAVEEGQAIVIDGHIVVRFVATRRKGATVVVRLGIDAPKDMTVNREIVEDEVNPGWRGDVRESAKKPKPSWEQRRTGR